MSHPTTAEERARASLHFWLHRIRQRAAQEFMKLARDVAP